MPLALVCALGCAILKTCAQQDDAREFTALKCEYVLQHPLKKSRLLLFSVLDYNVNEIKKLSAHKNKLAKW